MKRTYNELTSQLLQRCEREHGGENVVFSPLSMITLLLMLAEATGGSTREEIMGCLRSGGRKKLTKEDMLPMLREISGSASLNSANAVCVKHELAPKINEYYADALQKDFEGELFVSEDIIADVNRWVNEKTRGMIPEIADESMKDMVASLMNAVAFEAGWLEPYFDENIREGQFRVLDKSTTKVPMLHSREDCYIEDRLFTGFAKAYEGDEFSFMALLPKKKGEKALREAAEKADFTELFAKLRYDQVDVTMPEFTYSFNEDLTGFCKDLGIREAFSDHADFSPMTPEWLKVDQIIHKARIEVDRKGTKAAAVTMSVMVAGCAFPPEKPKTVRLDRPFLFAIMHEETGVPVFVGVVKTVSA